MKRLLLLCALLLVVPAAFAQANGSVVLTAKGALYTASVEWSDDHPDQNAASKTFIAVTVREADAAARRLVVPATLSAGANSSPSIAYNDDTDTLYVFWQYTANAMASELRFISLDRDGKWSVPSTFESATYHLRYNLRIGLTRLSTEKLEDGTEKSVSDVNVHATWWEESGSGERARYAMLTFNDEGTVDVHTYDLASFVTKKADDEDATPVPVSEKFNREILRHPAIFEAPNGETIDVVFGNVETNSFNRLKIGVISQARVRIPVGRSDKGIDAPGGFDVSVQGRIDAISPNPDRLVFYFEKDGTLQYIVNRDGEWTSVRSIVLTDGVTRDMALGAIRRFVGAQ